MVAPGERRDAGESRVPALRSDSKEVAPKQREAASDLGALSGLADVDVRISLEWGRSRITVQDALELSEGSLLRLEQHANDPVDIRVNGKLFGRGKLVVTGGAYGVQLLELV